MEILSISQTRRAYSWEAATLYTVGTVILFGVVVKIVVWSRYLKN